MDEDKSILGIAMPFQIGEHKIDLYPIRLKDWVNFRECVFVLMFDSLHKIYQYNDLPEALNDCIKIVTRQDEVPKMFEDMTERDYKRFRDIVIQQNDLNFEDLRKLGKDSKNAGGPSA